VERRLRQLLGEDGFAQPDEVEYGPRAITLYWHSVRKSVTVQVTERGEIGESRMGPPSPKWDEQVSSGYGGEPNVICLASLRDKKAVEEKARAMLGNHGLPQPDQVEYGDSCVRLLWSEKKVAVIIDLDEPPGFALPNDMWGEQLGRLLVEGS